MGKLSVVQESDEKISESFRKYQIMSDYIKWYQMQRESDVVKFSVVQESDQGNGDDQGSGSKIKFKDLIFMSSENLYQTNFWQMSGNYLIRIFKPVMSKQLNINPLIASDCPSYRPFHHLESLPFWKFLFIGKRLHLKIKLESFLSLSSILKGTPHMVDLTAFYCKNVSLISPG